MIEQVIKLFFGLGVMAVLLAVMAVFWVWGIFSDYREYCKRQEQTDRELSHRYRDWD
jgi:hypothetical protein